MTVPTATPKRPRTPEERREQMKHLTAQLDRDLPTAEIVADYQTRFGRSRRQCFRDLKLARRRLLLRVLKAAGGRTVAVALAERRLDRMVALALDLGNVRVALKAEVARCKLLGLYPEQQPFAPAPGPVRPDLHRPKPAPPAGTGAAAGGG